MLSELHPSETGKVLANNIITALQSQPPALPSRQYLEASARWIVGNPLGDALGLGRPGFYYWGLMAVQCVFLAAGVWIKRWSPRMDERGLKVCYSLFATLLLDSKRGIEFPEFCLR